MFPYLIAYPKLWLDQVLNWVYYLTEALLYREPLGLIFLVIASLASSFLINPIQSLVGLPPGDPIGVLVYVLGIAGALLALIEKRVPEPTKLLPVPTLDPNPSSSSSASSASSASPSHPSLSHQQPEMDEETGALAPEFAATVQNPLPIPTSVNIAPGTPDERAPLLGVAGAPSPPPPVPVSAMVWAWLALFIPFILLSVVYATYFVAQRYFADRYRINAYGYTCIDQILLPFSFYPLLASIAYTPGVSRVLDVGEDVNEPFLVSLRLAWAELSVVNMWMYRFFLNARAMIYFYLAVEYDLSRVYLELTLTRILLSWVGSLAVTLLLPRFIAATKAERDTQLAPLNLAFKAAGSILILLSMLRLNHVI